MNTTNIRALRRQRGWTQERLAAQSGVTVRTIQRLESGEDASLETLRLVAMALDVNIQDLFQNIESADKEEEIMDLDAERIRQMRKRSAQGGLYRKIMIFGFIFAMIALGAALSPVFDGNEPLFHVLALAWCVLWILGFSAIKAIRNLWMEPELDRKYPLTVGMDLDRHHNMKRY
ncbi:helix-turn-helix domain-containing protein [Bifidobacterium aquikefiricola]|uniref:Helix-turn-helix transcriptional regulator n=1 Tax=Bifidobacterium aquikefiricola TaxID=3059038 RepID=A0AB39U7G7_9BIFI